MCQKCVESSGYEVGVSRPGLDSVIFVTSSATGS